MSRSEFYTTLEKMLKGAKVNLGRKSENRSDFIEAIMNYVRDYVGPLDDVTIIHHDVKRTAAVLRTQNGVVQMTQGASQIADDSNGYAPGG